MDREGTALFTVKLEENEKLATPAAIDNKGNVYIGTNKAVRIIK